MHSESENEVFSTYDIGTPAHQQNTTRELRALNQAYLVVSYDAEGKIQAANFRFLRKLGCNLSEILNQTPARFLSEASARIRMNDLWNRLKNGRVYKDVGLWIATTGREIWLESRFVPFLDAQGKLESVVQISEDVSERLAHDVENLGQIDAITKTHAVVHFDLSGKLIWCNATFLHLTGYQRAEVLGQPHRMFVPPQFLEGDAYEKFWDQLKAGTAQTGEFRRMGKDGGDIWLQAVYTPIFDPAGRPIKVVKYAQDITAEKLKQADFQSQVAAIHKSNCTVTFDMHGSILDANDLFLHEVGYQLDEIKGRHHRIFVEPSYAHSAEYTSFWSDLRKGNYRSGLFKRYAKNGQELWLQATYNPIFDASGRTVKVIKYASVVTEEKLLQAEHQGQIAAINKAQCVISFDLNGVILDANENFLSAAGYRFSEVWGKHHSMFVTRDEAQSAAYREFWVSLATGKYCAGEFKRLKKNGEEMWLHATYNPIRDMDGKVFKVVKYANDITSEKLRQADFQGQIEAIRKSQDVIVFALDGSIIDVNERMAATLGYSREELMGNHHSMLVDRETAAGSEYLEFWKALKAGQHRSGLYRRVGKGGKEIWIQASYNPILDLNGHPFKVVKFATDVSENVAMAEAFEESRRQALIDSATSLPNRAKLTSFIGSHLAHSAATMAVFYIDLDQFGQVNERYGYRSGDRVLGEVADRLRRLLREDQMVARVGGDEFVIVAPGMVSSSVERFARNILLKIQSPILMSDETEILVSASIGIAMAPNDAGTPDEILRAGDLALASAKNNQRGSFSYYSEEHNARLHGQRKLIDEMRNSFVAGDFFLEFQPRFATQSREIESAEALIRWSHPERGRIGPVEFIPLAEQSGLIVEIGEWTLNQACLEAAKWQGIGVSVNLSPLQFADANLLQKVRHALERSHLPVHLLELEVTEGVLMTDSDLALEVLTSLKSIGAKLAIDDFGTGYSSLSYLRNFPFDVIKIDRSFVKDLDSDNSSRPIVQAIVALARAIGLTVTAEGVETEEQLALLADDGCDEIQGFLLGLPSPPSEIQKIVAAKLLKAQKKG